MLNCKLAFWDSYITLSFVSTRLIQVSSRIKVVSTSLVTGSLSKCLKLIQGVVKTPEHDQVLHDEHRRCIIGLISKMGSHLALAGPLVGGSLLVSLDELLVSSNLIWSHEQDDKMINK